MRALVQRLPTRSIRSRFAMNLRDGQSNPGDACQWTPPVPKKKPFRTEARLTTRAGCEESGLIKLYARLEAELRQKAPDEVACAEHLAANVIDPITSNADRCWPVIWTKPLYADTRVAMGDRLSSALCPSMSGAWRTIGKPGSNFVVTRVGRRSGRDAFSLEGSWADEIRTNHQVAKHR
jgi:hypothetical protein